MPPDWRALHSLGAAGLARAIAEGRVSAREAVEAHVRRIEGTTPRTNAVVVTRFEEARAEAARADERQARGEPIGPLHGVPITVKESFFLAGTPSTGGLPSRRGHRAEEDGPLVARLRGAGAIVVGKTNVPQLLLDIETDNPLYGKARNPWDPDRSPGGSSGGEAANLAAGGAALGLGTDLAGSVRLPAHACGIHGLMPTSRRLTLAGTFDALLSPGQEALVPQAGPLARRVEDLVLAFSVLAAPGGESPDPTLPPVPAPAPASKTSVAALRIGFCVDDGWFPCSPACRRGVTEAAAALAARGATVEEFVPPDVPEAMELFFGLMSAAGSGWARRLLAADPVQPRLQELLRASNLPRSVSRLLAATLDLAGQPRRARVLRALGRRSAADYWRMLAARGRYVERFLSSEGPGRFDVWIAPPAPTPALRHGASRFLLGAASYTMLYKLLGVPAGVVAATRVGPEEEHGRPPSRDPLERTAGEVDAGSAGLPVGVHVAARPWREDLVLAVMAALEEDFRGRPGYPDCPPL